MAKRKANILLLSVAGGSGGDIIPDGLLRIAFEFIFINIYFQKENHQVFVVFLMELNGEFLLNRPAGGSLFCRCVPLYLIMLYIYIPLLEYNLSYAVRGC